MYVCMSHSYFSVDLTRSTWDWRKSSSTTTWSFLFASHFTAPHCRIIDYHHLLLWQFSSLRVSSNRLDQDGTSSYCQYFFFLLYFVLLRSLFFVLIINILIVCFFWTGAVYLLALFLSLFLNLSLNVCFRSCFQCLSSFTNNTKYVYIYNIKIHSIIPGGIEYQ